MARYFLESGQYIETLTDVDPASRPAGSIAVTQRPSPDHQYQSGAWVYVAPIVDQAALRTAMTCSRSQMFRALRDYGFITPAEARAASKGDVPAAVAARFDQLPEPAQTDAYVLWAGFGEARRLDQMVMMLATVPTPHLTDAQMDDFFIYAKSL